MPSQENQTNRRILDAADADFESELAMVLSARQGRESSTRDDVAAIIDDVQARGDQSLIDAAKQFHNINLSPDTIAIPPHVLLEAWQNCSQQIRDDFDTIFCRIEEYHRHQYPEDKSWRDEINVKLGWRWSPIDSAGIYVPGGQANYPSTVFMLAIPAAVAQVGRIVMCVPPAHDLTDLTPTLAAAHRCGVTQVFTVGGAHAIAALAYGTSSISAVDIIAGPGNKWVTEAKRQVFGEVGIDMIAGPSEVVIVADSTVSPKIIADDLIAQAEHDTLAQSVLISSDAQLLAETEQIVLSRLEVHSRREIAQKSWRDFGLLIYANNSEIARVVNRIAPEHLQLMVNNPEPLLSMIRHAGAIFVGKNTPETIGDYVVGSSHVLPTSGSARFSSGVGVTTFMKRSSITECDHASLQKIGPVAARTAAIEGLEGHANSVNRRLRQPQTLLNDRES